MNIRTLPIWKLLPLYNFIQFPWRLLYLTTFFTSVAAALFLEEITKYKKIAAFLIILASISLTFAYFRPSRKVFKSDEIYLERFFENEQYSEDYLLLSQWTDEKPSPFENKFEISSGEVSNIINNNLNWLANIKAEEDAVLTFNAYYFPGWFAKLDGESVEMYAGKPNGQILIDIPTGEHNVEVYWAETNLRLFFDFVSLGSLGIVAWLLISKSLLLRSKIKHG